MADDDLWDVPDENITINKTDDGEETPDEWDLDSEEEELKKQEKLKLEQEAKQKAATLKQKMKQREDEERRKREARIAEANRIKTEAEKSEIQETAAQNIIESQLGDLIMDDEDDVRSVARSDNKPNFGDKDISSFSPNSKKDMDAFAEMITSRMYEFSSNTHFNYLLETTCRKLAEGQHPDNYLSVKAMGTNISTIGNEKQKKWRDSQKKGKKKSKGVTLGGGGKMGGDVMSRMHDEEQYDCGDDDGEFM